MPISPLNTFSSHPFFQVRHSAAQRQTKTSISVAILKSDKLSAAMIRSVLTKMFPVAMIFTFHRISELDAWAIGQNVDLLIAGVGLEDGSALDFIRAIWLPQKIGSRVLFVTTPRDPGLVARISRLGVSGLFDPLTDDPKDLEYAIGAVLSGTGYWSQSAAGIVASGVRSGSFVRNLTTGEIRVLKVVGTGCDDKEAAGRLGIKASSVQSVRRSLHHKLGIHHRAELVRFAVRYGFVELSAVTASLPSN